MAIVCMIGLPVGPAPIVDVDNNKIRPHEITPVSGKNRCTWEDVLKGCAKLSLFQSDQILPLAIANLKVE